MGLSLRLGGVYETRGDSPYFTRADEIVKALRRGVRVELLIGLNASTTPDALSQVFTAGNCATRYFTDDFHPKIFLFDGVAMLGSSNLTGQKKAETETRNDDATTNRDISAQTRSRGTVQSSRWTFKQRKPNEKWFVVVIRQDREWNHPDALVKEPYALVVTVADRDNENAKFYSQIQNLISRSLPVSKRRLVCTIEDKSLQGVRSPVKVRRCRATNWI